MTMGMTMGMSGMLMTMKIRMVMIMTMKMHMIMIDVRMNILFESLYLIRVLYNYKVIIIFALELCYSTYIDTKHTYLYIHHH